jgi:PAS domain S-box-containing protein|tara:strand:- start:2292 stop:3299 length:1008 start_codon:yes stop_codon:yes gene_type:complete
MKRKQYQQLIQSLPIGLITLDHAGQIASINQAGAALLGETAEYLHNLEFATFLHTDSIERFRDNRILAVDRSEALSTELVLRSQNGSTTCARCDFIPVRSRNLILCVQDISEIEALKSQISAGRIPDRKLLHDLNNVFTTIAGYAELTQMMVDERASVSGDALAVMHRYLDEIRSGLDRGEELIRDTRQQHLASAQQATTVDPLGKYVLIVDDEEPIVDFLGELMRQQGYEVGCFTSSKAALAYYRDHVDGIDLIILDQTMPELSGLELATEIKALRLDQPIILCTGATDLIEDQQSGKINIRYFASKPIDINELLSMVTEILQEDPAQQLLSDF